MSRIVLDNLKNCFGWHTDRRYIAFAVDDYGSVHLDSAAARDDLMQVGIPLSGQMDRFDAVETREDLEALFAVLQSVRDSRGETAVFTAYSLSANPDFERIEDERAYRYQSIKQTVRRLEAAQPQAYAGTWETWRKGIERGLIRPQFHGREHLNVEMFEQMLEDGCKALAANLSRRCVAGLKGSETMPGVGFTHAFGLCSESSLDAHRRILSDGLDLFEAVWGYRSETFTPPAQKIHPDLYQHVERQSIRAIDKPLHCVRNLGDGRKRREVNFSGRHKNQEHVTVVRNVVFEPGKNMGFEPVEHAIAQVRAAFRWNKPAIISSHRVNFSGHIDERNRIHGLASLKELLERLVSLWPQLEFVSVDRLIDAMEARQ